MTVFSGASSPVPGVVTDVRRALSALMDEPLDVLGDEEFARTVTETARLKAQVQALELREAAEAERRELAAASAVTGTDALLAQLTGHNREVINGGLWLARVLQDKYVATLAALGEGAINLAQAWVIVRAAEQIPEWATAEQVAAAEQWLIGKASGAGNRNGRPMSPKGLRRAALRMCAGVSTALAEAHREAMLNRSRRRGEAETWLTLHDNGDGTFRGRFVIPALHGHLLQAMLERLSAPHRWARDVHGDPANDPTLPGMAGHNWSERLGLAFCELVENLPTGGWSRNGINMIVTTSLDTLRKGLGSLRLDTGAEISAAEARRLACNAGIIPAVLGGSPVPLDLGRLKRLHDEHQRRALALMFDSCAAAGCDRPFAWTQIHHPHAWADGGPTDLANALPLCHFHHMRAHDDDWELYPADDGEWRFRRRKRTRWDLVA